MTKCVKFCWFIRNSNYYFSRADCNRRKLYVLLLPLLRFIFICVFFFSSEEEEEDDFIWWNLTFALACLVFEAYLIVFYRIFIFIWLASLIFMVTRKYKIRKKNKKTKKRKKSEKNAKKFLITLKVWLKLKSSERSRDLFRIAYLRAASQRYTTYACSLHTFVNLTDVVSEKRNRRKKGNNSANEQKKSFNVCAFSCV